MVSDQPVPRWRAWMTLCLLGLLYLVSFVDRFILALLVQPLKQDLGISEVQLGLLFGTAFALFYALLGLPFARLADRYDRRRLILAGAVLWSLSTIASGFANSYGWLVLLRVGLAIGEAALTPGGFFADRRPVSLSSAPPRRQFLFCVRHGGRGRRLHDRRPGHRPACKPFRG
jgi:predicted MFS family arabinose efflux permease